MTGLSMVAADPPIVNGVECLPTTPGGTVCGSAGSGVEIRRAAEAPGDGAA